MTVGISCPNTASFRQLGRSREGRPPFVRSGYTRTEVGPHLRIDNLHRTCARLLLDSWASLYEIGDVVNATSTQLARS